MRVLPDGELDIIPHPQLIGSACPPSTFSTTPSGGAAAQHGREVEEHVARALTALDEAELGLAHRHLCEG